MPTITVSLEHVWQDRHVHGMKLQSIADKYGFSVTTAFHKVKAAEQQFGNQVVGFNPNSPTPVPQADGYTYVPNESLGDMIANLPAGSEVRFGADKAEKQVDPAVLAKDYEFDNLYWQYRDFIGWKKDAEIPEKKPVLDNAEFSVIASDIHAPYENAEAVRWMVKRTFKKANRLIIGGDLADMFYFSKYQKFKKHFSAVEEMQRVQALLQMFSEAYDEVVILRGNHDDRYIKYLVRMGLDPEVLDVFQYLHGEYALHPIFVLTHGLKNVKVVESVNKDYASFGYLHQQGDAVISHAEKYSQVPNKAVGDVIMSLKSYHEPNGVVKPFKVVIQAHTHQAGKTWNDYGTIGIENGCLALTPDYAGGSRTLPRRASVVGYTELYQINGQSDFERTNFIPWKNNQ